MKWERLSKRWGCRCPYLRKVVYVELFQQPVNILDDRFLEKLIFSQISDPMQESIVQATHVQGMVCSAAFNMSVAQALGGKK